MDRSCPACANPLDPGGYGGVEVLHCEKCSGLLVRHAQLIPLLEKAATEVAAMIDIDTPLPTAEARATRYACPRCRDEMDHFGYMGTSHCYLDRCEACGLVWLGDGELTGAAILFARTELRRIDREAKSRDRTGPLDQMVDRLLLQRRLERRLFRAGAVFIDFL